MTKDVLVTIEGRQIGIGAEEEVIAATSPGAYHFKNGGHYIQYDENLEDRGEISKNTIKISPSLIILSKKSTLSSRMEFDLNEITQTTYQTPYGDFNFQIKTKSIHLVEEAGRLEVKLTYSLSSDDSLLSDNSIKIIIRPNE